MLNLFLCQFVIWKSSVIWNFKIELFEMFNYLIWYVIKMLNSNWSLVWIFEHVFKFGNLNEGKSAAGFCHQVAALVPDMFCNFYLAKNHKIANSSSTTEGR